MSDQLSGAQKNAASRISGLVLINAMIFQEILAEHDARVLPLQKMLAKGNLLRHFGEHWQFILDDIDYYPIFHVACQILGDLTATPGVVRALRELAKAAQGIVGMRAALRHDLMGRVYHRLLVEAKYLGTYYTGIPAASLLLKLALRPDASATEWHDLEQVRQLRIADLACGTGTLLMAAADSVTDNHISASAERSQHIDISALHNILAEEVLHGYDVLPSAIHLTASTLALRAPQIAFTKMNLFSLPLGGSHHRLGSIEFLETGPVQMPLDLFGAAPTVLQVAPEGPQEMASAELPDLDLCVMNPPFTRSVGGNLLFGSAPEDERKQMQKKLRRLVKRPGVLASITAGLGSVFVATADRHIRDGGRIALVLPKALLSGVAWKTTRDLLCRDYEVEYVVASQDPGRWNFSENTSLSEILLVACKVGQNAEQQPGSGQVTTVNLWRNPETSFEARAAAHALTQDVAPEIEHGQGALEVSVGSEKVGEAIALSWSELQTQSLWLLPCAFAQSDLIRAAYHLIRGRLWLPGYGRVAHVGLCPLGELATLGPDARDIADGFNRSQKRTPYAAFWGHAAKSVYALAQEANGYLSPLAKAKKGRPLRRAEDLWPRPGRVLIAERLRLNTHRVTAVRLPEPVLSNMWWPTSFRDELHITEEHEKALAVWLNSTLGVLLVFVNRLETEGPWGKFRKPVLAALPVLDLEALSDQLQKLASVYDSLSNETLQPFPDMDTDPIRAKIDESIAQVLDLPDFSILREMLAREPVVCLKRL